MEDLLYDIYKIFVEDSLLDDLYDNTLFTPITIAMIFFTFLSCVLFYKNPFAFRTWFYKVNHWILTMVLSAFTFGFLLSFVTCLQKAADEILRNDLDPEQGLYFDQGGISLVFFGIENFFVSCILFLIFSLFIRYTSILAKKTTF